MNKNSSSKYYIEVIGLKKFRQPDHNISSKAKQNSRSLITWDKHIVLI